MRPLTGVGETTMNGKKLKRNAFNTRMVPLIQGGTTIGNVVRGKKKPKDKSKIKNMSRDDLVQLLQNERGRRKAWEKERRRYKSLRYENEKLREEIRLLENDLLTFEAEAEKVY